MKDKLKDKMKKKFTDLSISHKMLMVYITFASAFLLIALGLTQISFRIYSKELYDKSLQELDYFSQNVNRGLKDAERNNYSISMDALVQRTLSDLSVLEYPSLDYNQKIRDLRRILLNEYDPESCVKSIIFVDLYGNTVEVGTAAWDVSGESFTAIKKQMEQGKGAYTTYGPTEECPYLLSGRVVRNRLDMSLSDMGKLIFVCDVGNVISENKESLSSNKAAIYVYNKNCAIYEDENIKKVIGFNNYIRIFTQDETFRQALKVTFIYVLFLVPLRLAFALLVAMLLNKKHKCLGLYRTIYYIPSIIGGSIAVSIVWRQIFGNQGVVMSLLSVFGINQKASFLGNPHTALGVIILMGVWQFGSSMLIFLAALKQIPGSLYESAMVDGAKQWTMFWKITLPMLTPTIFFNLILQIVNGFRVFTESYVITDGGPLDSTLSYVLYLYRRAFTYFDMGYSCALAWILVIIIAVFTIVLFKTQNNWVHYETGGDE